ncbi:putative colanic acid biosynthesis acetyltransferase [Oleiharenicola lentus]|uniref:putative colanic acid biosynthesis acetyltransferase n=1 Tax=Oleiharenicola lentus TaxID=2508720 RepID=UPI003F66A197
MANILSKSSVRDYYTNPTFSLLNRFRRLAWNIASLLIFRTSPKIFFGWRAFVLRVFGAKIGYGTYIYPSAKIWAPWLLRVDDVATIGPKVEIYNPGGVTLEHHAIASQEAYLCGGSHDFNDPAFPMTWKPIVLEPYSWVCARAVVMPGVTVGRGAVLGAAAVIGKNLEPMGIYVGNPAERIATRTVVFPHCAVEKDSK